MFDLHLQFSFYFHLKESAAYSLIVIWFPNLKLCMVFFKKSIWILIKNFYLWYCLLTKGVGFNVNKLCCFIANLIRKDISFEGKISYISDQFQGISLINSQLSSHDQLQSWKTRSYFKQINMKFVFSYLFIL